MDNRLDSPGNTKMPRKRQGGALRKSVVDDYVTRLRRAGLQQAQFDAVVSDMVADGAARKIEVVNIARDYVGVPLALKSKAAAIKIIRVTFGDLVRAQRAHMIASKLTPS
jgi:hypothetical protein